MQKSLMKLASLSIGLTLIFTSAVTYAQVVTVRGVSSCGEWVQEVTKRGNGTPDPTSSFWLLGYLSGLASYARKDVIKGTTTDSLYVWVSNYCQKNPLNNLSEAGDELYIELATRKGLKP